MYTVTAILVGGAIGLLIIYFMISDESERN